MNNNLDISRREFLDSSSKLSLAGLLNAYPLGLMLAQNYSAPNNRISQKAYQSASFQGTWTARAIEGQIPNELEGSLFRNGPGNKEIFGTSLKHLFDGDALITAFRFRQGQVSFQSKFVETEERKQEKLKQKMLYTDFGTQSPGRSWGYRNPPSINAVFLNNKLLTLSEGSRPIAVDPKSLETQGPFTFSDAWPSSLTFTAHPKVDPWSQDSFAFGISMGLTPHLISFRINKISGAATQLNSYPLGGFYPVHDMMLTENYIIYVVPPVYVGLAGAAMGYPLSQLIRLEKGKPLRILVLRKDGTGGVQEIHAPIGGVIFHHVNAYEDPATGNLIFDSVWLKDLAVYDLVAAWSNPILPAAPNSWLTRFEINLKQGKVISCSSWSDSKLTDFPCIDQREIGTATNHAYLLEATLPDDPLAYNQIACWNLTSQSLVSRITANSQQAFGEPLFAAAQSNNGSDPKSGWILHMGFDALKNETFLDIRSPVQLDLLARVWLGRFLPLGFHGCFSTT